MLKQRTVKSSVSFSGIALHTGARASLRIKPAQENCGILFKRLDLPDKPQVKALATNVVDVRRGTTIAEGNAVVYTVEHILSSLYAAGIDNAVIEMDGPEPPIADGSASVYWQILKDAGSQEQDECTQFWTCSEPIVVEQDESKIVICPADQLKITCIISFGETDMDSQFLTTVVNSQNFENIAPARTFCIYRELEQLLAMGLVKGGSLDNAVVLHNGAIICKDSLRYKDELVRHKILDIIGDLYLTGKRIKAHVIAVKPGHPLNVKLAGKMIEQNTKKFK